MNQVQGQEKPRLYRGEFSHLSSAIHASICSCFCPANVHKSQMAASVGRLYIDWAEAWMISYFLAEP